MRNNLFIATISFFLFACNSNTKNTDKKQCDNLSDTLSLSKKSRNSLIEELKRLKQTISSNDKQKIADIFDFPKPYSFFSVYVEDSTYLEQVKSNSNNVTKDIFLTHYKGISTNIWLDEMKYLLQNIPIDSLNYKDNLELSNLIEKEPCYNSYQIEIIGDSITLRMNMNSNLNFKSKKSSLDEIEENANEICDHSFWWTFKFDGTKLHFKTIGGAD